jgi:hypothetical protein
LFSAADTDFIRGVLEKGLLLENRHFPLARKILFSFLDRSGFSSDDVLILNGIPRHTGQANDIATIASIRVLVILECSVDSVFCRLRENTGGDRMGRIDDDDALVGGRRHAFHSTPSSLL